MIFSGAAMDLPSYGHWRDIGDAKAAGNGIRGDQSARKIRQQHTSSNKTSGQIFEKADSPIGRCSNYLRYGDLATVTPDAVRSRFSDCRPLVRYYIAERIEKPVHCPYRLVLFNNIKNRRRPL